MSNAFDMLAAIRDSHGDIRDALDPEQFGAFTQRSDQLGEQARTIEGPEGEEQLAAEILAVVDEYPAVRHILQRHAPDAFEPAPESDGRDPAALTSKGRPDTCNETNSHDKSAGNSTVESAAAIAPQGGGQPRADEPAGPAIKPAAAIAVQGGGQPPADEPAGAASGASRSTWTPDLVLHALKEAVAALIGLVLIGVTAYLAVRTFERAGDQVTMNDSKDVLQVVLGLAGVVLGYYFGRIPGDARAAQAQDQATATSARAARVAAKGEELASRLDRATATRGAADDEDAAAIQQLRAELRALAQAI